MHEPRELKVFEDPTSPFLKPFYRAYTERPMQIVLRSYDHKYYRVEQKTVFDEDGNPSTVNTDVPVCEDCWRDIPKYVDFPRGLVSPESDGDAGGNFVKHRPTMLDGAFGPLQATEAVQKSVCRECYLEAFRRVYPKARIPNLRSEVHRVEDVKKIEQPVTEYEFVGAPRA